MMRTLVLALAIIMIAPVQGQLLLETGGSALPDANNGAAAQMQMDADAPVLEARTPPEMFQAALDAIGPAAGDIEALRNIALFMQPPGNATNGTVLETQNGTHTHRHGAVGGDGLSQVWATPFHGIPNRVVVADLNGDGSEDAVVASDLSVTAIAADGSMLWARHLGSTVTGLAITDLGGDQRMDVVFSTLWEGQRARVEVVDAASGHERWTHVGETSFIGLTVTGTGDVIAADIEGVHTRLDGLTGSEVWRTDVDLIPEVGALLAGHYDLGHYMHESVDVNGDGTMDSVSVGMYQYFAFVPAPFVGTIFNVYNIVHAVDGATGESLWIHEVGLAPNPDGYRFTFLTSLTDLDWDGDDEGDIGYAGYTLWWFTSANIAGLWFEEFVRVVEGSNPAVAPMVSSKELLAPLLMLEIVTDMDHVDHDGDGNDEIALVRTSLVDALLNQYASQYERYEVMADADSNPTMVALGDPVIPLDGVGYLSDGRDDIAHFLRHSDLATGYVQAIDHGGGVAWDLSVPSGPARSVAATDKGLAVASTAALEFRDAAFATTSSFPLRGAPEGFTIADFDGDGFDDAWVTSSDGNVHVIDGLTGRILDVIDLSGNIVDIQPIDVGDGLDWRVLRVAGGETDQVYLELWDSADGNRTWGQEVGRVYDLRDMTWFDADGDGIDDLFTDWSFQGAFRIINGKTGETIADTEVAPEEVTTSFPDGFYAMRRADQADRMVVIDGGQGMVAINGDGSLAWEKGFDDYAFRMCAGAVDIDGDDIDELLLLRDTNPPRADIVRWGGVMEPLDGLPEMYWLNACSITRVAADGPEDALIGLTYYKQGDGYQNGFGRFTGQEWAWKDFRDDTFDAVGGIVPLGIDVSGGDGGRFYYGNEDHVIVARWADGEQLGQFTLDGPFVAEGVVMEMDGAPPAEVLALAADGMLWALATDAEAVQQVLVEEAVKQGKDVDVDVEGLLGATPDKKSPGPALPLLLLAFAVIAMRRR